VVATCRTLASAAPPIQGNNQLMWTVWGGVVWSGSFNWTPKSTTMTTITKQHCQSDGNNDGKGGNGRDRNGDGDGKGSGDDVAATTNGNNVDDNNIGVLRMALGQRQLDDNNATTMM
jgi:hypothetical protein